MNYEPLSSIALMLLFHILYPSVHSLQYKSIYMSFTSTSAFSFHSDRTT